jgi:hypothetical protein
LLRVSEIKILRRIFGPKGDENGKWRRIQNYEVHSLYRWPNTVRVIKSRILRCSGHVARMVEGRSALKNLIRKSTGRRSLGRTRHRWEHNIRIDLKEICVNTRNLVDSILNLWVP